MIDDRTPSASPHGDRNRGGNHRRDGADGDHGGHADGDSITIDTVHEEPDPAQAERDQRRWIEYAPTVVIDRLSPRELDLAFPGASRDEAVEALRLEREEFSALSDRERERSYERDTREAEAYLQRGSFPERLVMRIGK